MEAVQELLSKSRKTRTKVYSKHPFAGKTICGDCGEFYGHKVWRVRSTGEHYDIWYCNHKYDGDTACETSYLRETDIKTAFEQALSDLGEPDLQYSDERWQELVQSLTVYQDGRLRFLLACGETTIIVP